MKTFRHLQTFQRIHFTRKSAKLLLGSACGFPRFQRLFVLSCLVQGGVNHDCCDLGIYENHKSEGQPKSQDIRSWDELGDTSHHSSYQHSTWGGTLKQAICHSNHQLAPTFRSLSSLQTPSARCDQNAKFIKAMESSSKTDIK